MSYEMLYKTCVICQKEFTKPLTESMKDWNNRHVTCSRECASKYCSVQHKLKGIRPPAWPKGRKQPPRTEEHRRKLGLARKGKTTWMKGKHHTEDALEKIRAGGLKGVLAQQKSKGPTSIEKIVYDYLVLNGIIFEKQYLVNGKFLVDAYIPSLDLVIEADGTYWHSLPRVVKKDKSENAYLTKCGYKLLRLTETEIKNGSFKEKVLF